MQKHYTDPSRHSAMSSADFLAAALLPAEMNANKVCPEKRATADGVFSVKTYNRVLPVEERDDNICAMPVGRSYTEGHNSNLSQEYVYEQPKQGWGRTGYQLDYCSHQNAP